VSVDWLEILERAQRKRCAHNAPPSIDEYSENTGGEGIDKRVKRGDNTPIASCAGVFELARLRFPERDGLPVPPPARGRDPLVHRNTDKVRFFRADRQSAGAEG
jgi:hypothetical protein